MPLADDKHHSFSVKLLSRTTRRDLKIIETCWVAAKGTRAGDGSARPVRDVRRSFRAVTEPFVHDLPARTDLSSNHFGIP
jgi:hypothetical protein